MRKTFLLVHKLLVGLDVLIACVLLPDVQRYDTVVLLLLCVFSFLEYISFLPCTYSSQYIRVLLTTYNPFVI